MREVYLDHAAATPLDATVKNVMQFSAARIYANPGAIHRKGMIARAALAAAREKVARVLGAHADEVIFTGSGTEGNNIALQGTVSAFLRGRRPRKAPHVVVSAIEHPSVLAVCGALSERGVSVSYLEVDGDGFVDSRQVYALLRPETVLVSVMYANNEVGTIEPLTDIAREIRRFRAAQNSVYPYFHTDACQAAGYLDLDMRKLGVDLLTLNGSKIYGPRGVGILYRKRGIMLDPIMFGGDQEYGLRPGTEAVSLIAGIGEAIVRSEKLRGKESRRLSLLRDYFMERLVRDIPGCVINGSKEQRLPNNVHISIPGVESDELIISLDAKRIYASAKSACKSGEGGASHVILALKKNFNKPASGIRFSLGRTTTKRDVDYVLSVFPGILARIRRTR